MTLPQLPPDPIRPEHEQPEADKEIWQPRWHCFCCEDTGIVSPCLARLVVSNYDHHRHKSVACQHRRCEAGRRYHGNPNFDQRFTTEICNELDRINREDWRKVVQGEFELAQMMRAENEALASQMKMPGSRDRTANDEREIQQRKQEIEAITPEQSQNIADQDSA